ncbi:MAG: alginate lyase family protein [Nitrospira sp.]|nr:alginate lyase family protein [Nitrospira sp.]
MTSDASIGLSERIRSKIRSIGLGAVLRMGVFKVLRPLASRWQRLQVRRQVYRIGREELANALGTSPDEILSVVARMRTELSCRLPVAPADVPAIRSLYLQHAPGLLDATIESADQVCEHVFDLLGSGPVALGPAIDWHVDFKSGYRWNPDLCFLHIAHSQTAGVDIKVPWELSRGHHLVLLAQTGLLTGDKKYSGECVKQISDWIVANPPGYGVNWACPMDVAIRAVNWLWTLALLAEWPDVNDAWWADVLATLVAHGRFLMTNLEVRDDGVTTNHYLADVVGLLYLGLCLKEVRDAERWRTFAVRELVAEMERQVLPDGVHYESSLSYHRLVTEMFLSSAVLCRRQGVELPPPFYNRLTKMCDFVQAYTKPNGLAPQIGDGDNGRLHMLTGYGRCDVRDHRHLLAVGGVLFDREDWRAASGSSWVEGLWFAGARQTTWAAASAGESRRSVAFPAGGFYILREEEDYVLFNCNPPGTSGVGTHKHNDVLSLEMHLGGEDILVDPGCFLYTSDPRDYNRFRSTCYHSTVRVDQAEQNRVIPEKLFCLHPDSRLHVMQWEIGQPVEQVAAEHHGYDRLADPVRHRREVQYHRSNGSWQVIDHLSSLAGRSHSHRLEWTLTFAPQCSLHPAETGWHVVTPNQRLWLEGPQLSAGGRFVELSPYIDEANVAPQYGALQRAPFLRWSWEGPFPAEGRFTISRAGSQSA